MQVILTLTALLVIACSPTAMPPSKPVGRAFTVGETLFHHDPRWLGADAALSIPLGNDRILWLFGDTFVAITTPYVRSASRMVRNTVAIQTGANLSTASITFHWRQEGNAPASFFPEQGQHWYWPGHGIRLNSGSLVIFLYRMVATPGKGLGFATAGYAVAVIDNPDAFADAWQLRITDITPSAFDAMPATAVIQDGAYLVAVAIRQEGTHVGALVRYSMELLAQGDSSRPEWWAGEQRGWVPEAMLGVNGPTFVIDDAGAECSLHWDERSQSFIHVASYGFGASTIGLRTAPALTGPWSAPIIVYQPPESDGPHPFVYAAKAHPALIGPDAADLVITYATNSFTFSDLFTPAGERSLYWPRFVLVRINKEHLNLSIAQLP